MKNMFWALLLIVGFGSGCYYDVEEELYPDTGCRVQNMSYQADILPILTSRCYVCHSAAANNGGISLEGYASLQRYVDNGQLLGAIRHDGGFSPMPKNAPQLPACQIEQIQAWIATGAPDN
jgi:hypothetical protein